MPGQTLWMCTALLSRTAATAAFRRALLKRWAALCGARLASSSRSTRTGSDGCSTESKTGWRWMEVDTQRQWKMLQAGTGRSISASIILTVTVGFCSSAMRRPWIRQQGSLATKGTVADRVDENDLPEIHRFRMWVPPIKILMLESKTPKNAEKTAAIKKIVDKLLVWKACSFDCRNQFFQCSIIRHLKAVTGEGKQWRVHGGLQLNSLRPGWDWQRKTFGIIGLRGRDPKMRNHGVRFQVLCETVLPGLMKIPLTRGVDWDPSIHLGKVFHEVAPACAGLSKYPENINHQSVPTTSIVIECLWVPLTTTPPESVFLEKHD